MGLKKYKYIFGPVASRRLGLSLGIDLIPYKVCSLDCIYCECGRTTKLTIQRKEYFPTNEILKEIDSFLKNPPEIDIITFSGSGEPTLHKDIGKIIKHLKTNYDYPVCILTNGTLLYKKSVQKSITKADIVIPSLDSGSITAFNKINRPHKKLNLEKIINGIAEFNKNFNGELWLEVFIVPNINDSENEVKQIIQAAKKIKPDKVQLNTLDRPGTEDWVVAERYDKLQEITKSIGKHFPTEIIARKEIKEIKTKNTPRSIRGKIVNILKRRPSTPKELSKLLNISPNELDKHIKAVRAKRIKINGQDFLSLAR